MKKLSGLIFGIFLQACCLAQESFIDTVTAWFKEIKRVCHQTRTLWNLDLHAPILLVDPGSRQIYSNSPDSMGVLQKDGEIFTGILPPEINIANTALEWSGLHWAMVMLPLPQGTIQRIHLIGHELFHRAQKTLGFTASNPDNNHLDKKDGRILLRLELEALRKAVMSPTQEELKRHISRALQFRSIRYETFFGSASSENQMELNEGLAEFTGFMFSGRKSFDARKYFSDRIRSFMNTGSFTRSFAYEMIPVYGFLLNPDKKGWNLEIRPSTNFIDYFRNAFGVSPEAGRRSSLPQIGRDYSYARILAEETARETEFLQKTALYSHRLIDTVHLEIPLINMSMSFDYTSQFSLNNEGTVYQKIRITDEWGILEAEEGALVNSNWSKVHVSCPLTTEGNTITGQGWVLTLTEGFRIEKDPSGSGNYNIKKSGQ